MTTTLHFTQIDTKSEVAQRIAQIEAELAQLRDADALLICISAQDLFHLEALGYVVDLLTGEVSKEIATSKAIPF